MRSRGSVAAPEADTGGGWRLERRPEATGTVGYRVVAVLLAVIVSLFIALQQAETTYGDFLAELWRGTFGTARGFENVATLATPLILFGLAASIPYRMGLWNIGAEGQLVLGAWAAIGLGFLLPDLSGPPLIAMMLIAAIGAGALWALGPALARVYLGVNEIISTLLLNFVAGFWVLYWAGTRWREPLSAGGVRSRRVPEQSELESLETGALAVPPGFLIAVGLALVFSQLRRHTKLGYESAIVGASPRTAEYAGIPTRRLIPAVLLLGGGFAGLGGAIELLGNVHRYGEGLSNNTGFAGIIVAVLAAGSEGGVIVMAIVFAVITVAGSILRVAGASSDLIFASFGLMLFFAAIGQGAAHLRLVRRRAPVAPASPGASTRGSA